MYANRHNLCLTHIHTRTHTQRERENELMQVGDDANGVADNGITPLSCIYAHTNTLSHTHTHTNTQQHAHTLRQREREAWRWWKWRSESGSDASHPHTLSFTHNPPRTHPHAFTRRWRERELLGNHGSGVANHGMAMLSGLSQILFWQWHYLHTPYTGHDTCCFDIGIHCASCCAFHVLFFWCVVLDVLLFWHWQQLPLMSCVSCLVLLTFTSPAHMLFWHSHHLHTPTLSHIHTHARIQDSSTYKQAKRALYPLKRALHTLKIARRTLNR